MTPRLSKFCPHLPTSQQSIALVAHRFLPDDAPSEVFYGGAAGGGKSDWLLMGALEYVDVPGYAAIIFRRSFTDLALPGAIMSRAKEWLTPFHDQGVKWNHELKQWLFPAGSTLQFAYLAAPGDEFRYQSAEFQYIGFDELTQFPEAQYTYLFSRCRRPAEGPLANVPLRMRAASNPGGVGHGWVKERFPIGHTETPAMKRGRVFVPAKIADNPHLDADSYRKGLAHLDDTLRRQLEEGDWQVAEGLAYRITADHLIDEFVLQNAHSRFEAADYGFNGAPWCLWVVDYDGNLIAYDMLYGRNLLPSEMAPLIREKRDGRWGRKNEAFIDPSVWHRTGTVNRFGQPAMLADEFFENGIAIIKGNNDPRAGMARIRELLKLDERHRFPLWHPKAGQMGAPRLFIHRGNCPELVKELSSAPLQPIDKIDGLEKVDPRWESQKGHAAAMTRYAVMTRPEPSKEPPVGGLPPAWTDEDAARARREALDDHFARRRREAEDDRTYVP